MFDFFEDLRDGFRDLLRDNLWSKGYDDGVDAAGERRDDAVYEGAFRQGYQDEMGL